MGFFQGIGSLLSPGPGSVPVEPFLPFNTSMVGHVLDVIMDENHKSYDPGKNQVIGTVFFRDAFGNYGGGIDVFSESGAGGKSANPIDRTNLHIPLPGEQVLIFKAKSSRLDGPDVFVSSKYFYSTVVNMSPNITYNSAPFIGVDPDLLNPFLPGTRSVGELSKRFDKKIKSLASFKEGKKAYAAKQIQINEGDFILQGRFGGSIRFAGTPIASQVRGQGWAEGSKGLPGDPILIMRIDNGKANINKLNDTLYETEDVNTDGASMYMTTTQQIPLELALPEKGKKAHPLATWAYVIGEIGFETDIEKTANAVKDGEAARDGDDKVSKKEGSTKDEVKDVNTDPDAEDELPSTQDTEGPNLIDYNK